MIKNPNYSNILNQLAQLKAQAEMLRSTEVNQVIAEIKTQMGEYGITLADLGANAPQARAGSSEQERTVLARRKPDVKFKDPVSGATWTGRGKIPKWMKPALEGGATKEQFLIA